ncbi:transcriptional regulation of mitochondrial recombination-domain-containing protein [Aspergillus carlsbadensis]|nr:transcriptional regulation of mitochondrial recombination-domain-containing protein [Aspergillus carlsbadensis]
MATQAATATRQFWDGVNPAAHPKRSLALLDPTKMGTWQVVRRPPIEKGAVIQGLVRARNSNAFKTHQLKEGVRLKKALSAVTHGKNIFVYHNIRTNQVVYSLTRYLEKNNVLKQLIYHGKKTVPATLRKDMWTPYYSVHFQDSKVGLRAFHLLREFSKQRQLDPPREMITITEKYLAQKRPRDPTKVKEFDEKYADKLGWLMEKKDRARAVMDQKATSVADISAVIGIQEKEIQDGFGEYNRGPISINARKRRAAARRKEAAKAAEHAERIAKFATAISSPTAEMKVMDPKDAGNADPLEVDTVKILWNDMHDARYAQSWPMRVVHGELDLSRDNVMAGQKAIKGEVLASYGFKERDVSAN